MKAVFQTRYGSPDGFELREIDKPRIKKADEVLVRVHAAALNAGDVFMMRGVPWMVRLSVGFPRPKNHVPGWDMAGAVEAVGKSVTRFRPGDEVFSSCHGTLAEYVCAAETHVAKKPVNLTFEQAAAVPTAAVVALQELQAAGKLQPGSKVLVNGASGGVGTFAVQVAKALGADVTGVCSTKNIDMVRSIGADHVIDYTQEDFTQGNPGYDLILDNVGSRSFSDLRRALAPDGIVQPNTGHAGMGYVIKAFMLAPFLRKQGRMFLVVPKHDDLVVIKDLIESGKVTPVIDRTYALSETTEAFRYLNEGHAQGKVVIRVEH
ncbi:NAD(P)-dependent alcohol dehydrogenase [Candidatus Bipolaricaulota bacterium]